MNVQDDVADFLRIQKPRDQIHKLLRNDHFVSIAFNLLAFLFLSGTNFESLDGRETSKDGFGSFWKSAGFLYPLKVFPRFRADRAAVVAGDGFQESHDVAQERDLGLTHSLLIP